jgi:hypothetical protein
MNCEDWEIIKRHLEDAICKTVQEFRDNPSDFLSENDIQAVLFAELRYQMRHLRMRYDSSCAKDKCFGESLDVSRVLSEYQLASEGNCDIGILCGEQDVDTLNLWQRPCRIGIEVKFWQALEQHNWKEPRGLHGDVAKLQRYWKRRDEKGQPFTGIVILFVHPGPRYSLEMESITGREPGVDFPENGVSLHLVTPSGHWWNKVPALQA